ncbi:halocyanin domain-containing protein [Halobacteriales archaeon Cl-PHB]
MNRREFLRTAGGAAGASAAVSAAGAGPAAAAESGGDEGGDGGGGTPDFGGYLDDANLYEGSVQDLRGEDPTVSVGAGEGFAFDPPAIHVDNGATVTWEWTGQGGSHNVVHEDGDFESELKQESGATFEHTFEEDGIYTYYCQPHKAMGMKGAVVVGTDYATAGGGGGGGIEAIDPTHFGVPFQPHFVGAATILMMMVSLVFTFFTLKYGESANAKGGNN